MAEKNDGAKTTTANETTKPVVVVFGNSETRPVDGAAIVAMLGEIKNELNSGIMQYTSGLMANAGQEGHKTVEEIIPINATLMGIVSKMGKATEEQPVIPQIEFSGILSDVARKKMVQQLMAANNVSEEDAKKKLQIVTGFSPEKPLQKKIAEYFVAAAKHAADVKHNETIEDAVKVESSLNENEKAVEFNTNFATTLQGMKPADITPVITGEYLKQFVLQFGKVKTKRASGGSGDSKNFGSMEGTVKFTLNGKTFNQTGLDGTDMLNEVAAFGVDVDSLGNGVYKKHADADGKYTNSKNGSEPKFRHVAQWLHNSDDATDVHVSVVKPSKVDGIEDQKIVFADGGKYASKGL